MSATGPTAAAAVGAILFFLRERSARHPLLDLKLVAHPLVSSGLAFKAAAGLVPAALGYMVTLQLQLDWGWTPALAAIGMLPQVLVLVAGGAVVNPFVKRVGLEHCEQFLRLRLEARRGELARILARLLCEEQAPGHQSSSSSSSSIGAAMPSRMDSRMPGIETR